MEQAETIKGTGVILGDRIKRKREERGISQVRLAELATERGLKWAQATVWSIEQERRQLQFTEAITLADLLGMDLDELAGSPWRDRYMDGYRDGVDAARKAIEELTK